MRLGDGFKLSTQPESQLEILLNFLQNWDEILIKISANLHDRRHKKETNILTLKGHFL